MLQSTLANEQNATALMTEGRILQTAWYTSFPKSEKDEVNKCILFIYGFLLAPVRSNCAEEWKTHPAQHRIRVVRAMTSQNKCRRRLLSIADASGDNDLTEAGSSCYIFQRQLRGSQ